MLEEEDQKKPGEGEAPPSETMLTESRDPDEAVIAEQAILHYVHWVLEEVQESIVDAVDSFGTWVISQADPSIFDNPAFFDQTGRAFLSQMSALFGGATPIYQHLCGQLDGAVDQAASQEVQAPLFVHELARATRDAMWYLRDNLQTILSNQWDQLRDLAYEGSTEFIPLVHMLGLPTVDLDASQIASALVDEGERFRLTIPAAKEEATKDAGIDADPESESKAEAQKQTFDDEAGEKQQTA
ncbi:MAG: hypothetical protein ACHQ17_12940 [Polyangia bacterium]|jgi:hypothetical protein